MMIGHSAGAHLCMMAVLELIVKRYQQDPNFQEESTSDSTLAFEEKHFNGNGAQMEGSFFVINNADNNDITKVEESDGNNSLSASYQILDKGNGDKGSKSDKEDTEPCDSEDKEVEEFMDQTDPSLAVEESKLVEKVELTDAQRQLVEMCNSIRVCVGKFGKDVLLE